MERPDLGPLDAPPSGFAELSLPLVTWHEALVRIHRADRDPVFFGRTRLNRFDAPAGQFGVLYAAADLRGAFIETFGDSTRRIVSVSELTMRASSVFDLTRPLSLVDLRGAGLARIGTDARLFAADHGPAQQWSLALWQHPAHIDGLCYPARHDPSRTSVAVFDRARSRLHRSGTTPLMAASARIELAAVLDAYDFGLIEA